MKLTDLRTGISASRLVVQASLWEVHDLATRFMIKQGSLVLGFKRGHWCDWYGRRGFRVPVSIPLSDFFGTDQESVL